MKAIITNHSSEIDAFLNSIRGYKPLTIEQENEAINLYKTGDEIQKQRAAATLLNANQRQIFSQAKKYAKNDTLKIMDYVQEGGKGLIGSIDKFDTSKGFRFFTYAIWYIRQAMELYANTTDQLVRKTNLMKVGTAASKIKEDIWKAEHREATVEEIQINLEARGIKISNLRDLESVSMTSLESSWGDDATFEENPEYIKHTAVRNEIEDAMDAEENSALVAKCLRKLSERDSDIIKMLFGIGYDCAYDPADVAAKYGMTETRIGQIKNTALKRMAE